jgi:hypothetical protein
MYVCKKGGRDVSSMHRWEEESSDLESKMTRIFRLEDVRADRLRVGLSGSLVHCTTTAVAVSQTTSGEANIRMGLASCGSNCYQRGQEILDPRVFERKMPSHSHARDAGYGCVMAS